MRTSLTLSFFILLAGCGAAPIPAPASYDLRALILPLDDAQFAPPTGSNQLGDMLRGVDSMLTPAGIDLQHFLDTAPISLRLEVTAVDAGHGRLVVSDESHTVAFSGTLLDHHLSAKADQPLILTLPSLDRAEVTLDEAAVELDLATDQPWLVGTLSGQLDRASLRQALSPVIARLVNDQLHTNPGTTLSVQLQALFDHGCSSSPDRMPDGVIETCEVAEQPLLWSYLGAAGPSGDRDPHHSDAIRAGVGLFGVKIR